MAKVQLKAGAQVDFLTDEELSKRLDALSNDLKYYWIEREGLTLVRDFGPITLTSSGNTLPDGKSIYRVRDGFYGRLTRLTVDFNGSTFATPLAPDIRLYANSVTPSTLRDGWATIPAVRERSESHAPQFGPGEDIVLYIAGSVAGLDSVNVTGSLQVILKPITPRVGRNVDVVG